MQINEKIISENEVVVEISGDIDFSNSDQLKNSLFSLFEKGFTEYTLDFKEVEGIDSSGLGKLLLFQKMLGEEDGVLKITNVESDYIQNMFEMIQLDQLIEIEE